MTSDCTDETRHFFPSMAPRAEEKPECGVATEFCSALERLREVPVRLIHVRERPDALIEVDGTQVFLELAGYRQRDEYHELEVRESLYKSALADSLHRSAAPLLDIHIWWREEARRKRQPGMSRARARLRDKKAPPDFLAEFVRLVRFAADDPRFTGRPILFRDTNIVAAFQRSSPATPMLDKAEYPTLAHYCSSVTLDALSHPPPPLISSSFDARGVSVDFAQIEHVVEEHLKKLANYRDNVGANQIWLVIHADGMPPSTWTNEAERDEVFRKIREAAARSCDQFDAIWWAENTRFFNAAKIWRVI